MAQTFFANLREGLSASAKATPYRFMTGAETLQTIDKYRGATPLAEDDTSYGATPASLRASRKALDESGGVTTGTLRALSGAARALPVVAAGTGRSLAAIGSQPQPSTPAPQPVAAAAAPPSTEIAQSQNRMRDFDATRAQEMQNLKAITSRMGSQQPSMEERGFVREGDSWVQSPALQEALSQNTAAQDKITAGYKASAAEQDVDRAAYQQQLAGEAQARRGQSERDRLTLLMDVVRNSPDDKSVNAANQEIALIQGQQKLGLQERGLESGVQQQGLKTAMERQKTPMELAGMEEELTQTRGMNPLKLEAARDALSEAKAMSPLRRAALEASTSAAQTSAATEGLKYAALKKSGGVVPQTGKERREDLETGMKMVSAEYDANIKALDKRLENTVGLKPEDVQAIKDARADLDTKKRRALRELAK